MKDFKAILEGAQARPGNTRNTTNAAIEEDSDESNWLFIIFSDLYFLNKQFKRS